MARKNQTILALDAVVADTTSVTYGGYSQGGSLTVQVSLTTAASVTVEGRLSPDAPWETITEAPITVSSIVKLAKGAPQVRVVSTGVSDALSVWLRSD